MSVTIKDVESAKARLAGVAVITPLLEYPVLADRVGGRVLVKFEGAQREGSFKFRGAYNRLVQLSASERAAGVVAWSSGNHAQGVAAAALLLNIRATIVMPAKAPAVKIDNTRALGAEIVLYEPATQSREVIARELCAERGAVLVPSYDDPHIIAGQGTVGLEIAGQAGMLGAKIDQLLCCCGGGGLIAGTAIALRDRLPDAEVYCVEPRAFDDTARSLAAGHRIANAGGGKSICDALLAPEPGELTFAINKQLLAGALTVTDDEVRRAMAFAFFRLKLVAEPGGSVALAALLAGKLATVGRVTALVISGSNVDPALFAQIIAAGPRD